MVEKRILAQGKSFRLYEGDLEKLRKKYADNPDILNEQDLLRYIVSKELNELNESADNDVGPDFQDLRTFSEQAGLKGVVPFKTFGFFRFEEFAHTIIKVKNLTRFLHTYEHTDRLIKRLINKKLTLIILDLVKDESGTEVLRQDHIFALRVIREEFDRAAKSNADLKSIDYSKFMIVGVPDNPELPTYIVFKNSALTVVPDESHADANIALHYFKDGADAHVVHLYRKLLEPHYSKAKINYTPTLLGDRPITIANLQFAKTTENPSSDESNSGQH